MTLALALLELSITDFKTSNNVIESQQAFYNAEAGIKYGIRKLQSTHFDGSYTEYNANKDYIYDEGKNYSTTDISYSMALRTFTVKSKGFYGRFSRNKTLEVDKYSILNLRRKLSAGDFLTPSGRVIFKTYNSNSYVKLQDYEQILRLSEGEINPFLNIYTFFNGEDISTAVRNTGRYLFQSDSSRVSRIYKITTPSFERKEWKPYGVGIQYYVSGKGESINLNLGNICEESNGFIKGFNVLGGIINAEGKLENSCARVLLVDGNISLSGIKGEYSQGITNAERYFENLVVYCTGKATIDDCEFLKSGDNSDLNMAIIANEIEFTSPEGSTGNIISHLKGNEGLIYDCENSIADLLQVNTEGEFICATGY